MVKGTTGITRAPTETLTTMLNERESSALRQPNVQLLARITLFSLKKISIPSLRLATVKTQSNSDTLQLLRNGAANKTAPAGEEELTKVTFAKLA